jgi:hypothetical protein
LWIKEKFVISLLRSVTENHLAKESLNAHFPTHPEFIPIFCGVCVAYSLVFWIVFSGSLFDLLPIVLTVLQFTVSVYTFLKSSNFSSYKFIRSVSPPYIYIYIHTCIFAIKLYKTNTQWQWLADFLVSGFIYSTYLFCK